MSESEAMSKGEGRTIADVVKELRRLLGMHPRKTWHVVRGHEGWDIDGVTDNSGMDGRSAALIVFLVNHAAELCDALDRLREMNEMLAEVNEDQRKELVTLRNHAAGNAAAGAITPK
jgi:hypothetical protein